MSSLSTMCSSPNCPLKHFPYDPCPIFSPSFKSNAQSDGSSFSFDLLRRSFLSFSISSSSFLFSATFFLSFSPKLHSCGNSSSISQIFFSLLFQQDAFPYIFRQVQAHCFPFLSIFLFLETSPLLFASFVRVHVHALFLHCHYFPFRQVTIKTIGPSFASRSLLWFCIIACVGPIRVSGICQTGLTVAHEIKILPWQMQLWRESLKQYKRERTFRWDSQWVF